MTFMLQCPLSSLEVQTVLTEGFKVQFDGPDFGTETDNTGNTGTRVPWWEDMGLKETF